MPLSDHWTLTQLHTAVRLELMDSGTRWWSKAELTDYLNDWQSVVQTELELVWGTASVVIGTTTASATITLTTIAPNMLRFHAAYWNGLPLVTRTEHELASLDREWRNTTENLPGVVVPLDRGHVALWPPPGTSGTLTLEYPIYTTFTGDNDPMFLPAWTRYSALDFTCWRALMRAGPTNNLNRALRRKKSFDLTMHQYRATRDSMLATYSPTLRPGARYEADTLLARTRGAVTP